MLLIIRNKSVFVGRIIMPVLFALGGLAINKFVIGGNFQQSALPALPLSAALYNNNPEDRTKPNMTYEASPPRK